MWLLTVITRIGGVWSAGMPHPVHQKLHTCTFGTGELQQTCSLSALLIPGVVINCYHNSSWSDSLETFGDLTKDLGVRFISAVIICWEQANQHGHQPGTLKIDPKLYHSFPASKSYMLSSEAVIQALLKLPPSRSKRQKNYTLLQARWQRNSPFSKSFLLLHTTEVCWFASPGQKFPPV